MINKKPKRISLWFAQKIKLLVPLFIYIIHIHPPIIYTKYILSVAHVWVVCSWETDMNPQVRQGWVNGQHVKIS